MKTYWPVILFISCGAVLTLLHSFAPSRSPLSRIHSKFSTQQKTVALTFDDGPNPPFTEELLKILDRHEVSATFFFSGKNIKMHRNTALKVVNAGHEIANHGFSHQSFWRLSPQAVVDEITRTDALIASLGVPHSSAPIRPPFGSYSPQFTLALWRLNRIGAGFSLQPSPPDYYRSDPEMMERSLLADIESGDIVLLHDGEGIRTETLDAVNRLITSLKQRGFNFVTFSKSLHTHQNI